jgi:hypothetical protein
VVLCDFAENYSFDLQDGAQGFHWNTAQATIHPFVIYFKKSGALNTEHTFQQNRIKFIENTFKSN